MNTNHNKQPATMPALPLDVIVHILCRLPVKTLLRFRCLSKQFRSIIDDPDFIKRHLQCHSSEQRLIVKGAYLNLLFLDLDSVDNAFKLEHPFENWGHGYGFGVHFENWGHGYGFGVHVIGSCDGLLALLNTHHNSIGLWNISTKKHRILPDECLHAKYGFGRDAATDDYKLVKIANFDVTNVTQVSVYSLNANCWRRIDGFPAYSRCNLRDMAALVEGKLNWVGESVDADGRRNYFIVSFDLKNETFFEVSLPDTIGEIEGCELSVTVLGGCLCLLYHDLNHFVFDMWVMKEYGVKDSWNKPYWFSYAELPGIPEFPRFVKAFVYSKHGDQIFIFPNYGGAFRHDLEEKKSEIVEINNLPLDISSEGCNCLRALLFSGFSSSKICSCEGVCYSCSQVASSSFGYLSNQFRCHFERRGWCTTAETLAAFCHEMKSSFSVMACACSMLCGLLSFVFMWNAALLVM